MSDEVKTVWAVTSGEYSDFGIHAVFADEETANQAVRAGFGDDVREYDFYPSGVLPSKRVYFSMHGQLDAKTADLAPAWPQTEPLELADHPVYRNEDWARPMEAPRRSKTDLRLAVLGNRRRMWFVNVEAKTEKLARKVFYDLVAKTRSEILEGLR